MVVPKARNLFSLNARNFQNFARRIIMKTRKKLYGRGIRGVLIVALFLGFLAVMNLGSVFGQDSLVENHSFEDDLDLAGWTTNGSSAITTPENDWVPDGGGSKLLNYWDENNYEADTYQTISGLENGEYILSAWVANDGEFEETYMYAKNTGVDEVKVDIRSSGDWTEIKLPVVVEDGEVTIGFYAEGLADAWLGIDLVTLVKDGDVPTTSPEREDFIYGVDTSTLSKVEDYGGKFYDDGEEKGALDILTDYGSNYARLKIWEDPVDVYDNGIAYNDLDDTIKKAVEIKEADMKFLLNFHYSGFWADPGQQAKPVSWEDLSFDELVEAVYDHTFDTIEALKAEDAAPDMVQVGNEIRPGMLFPDGEITNGDYSNLAELLNSGIDAVRDTLGDDVDIMLHLDQGGDNGAFRSWFDGIISEGVTDFQIIGASYYPYWHGTLEDLEYNLNDISDRYDRDVVVVETAYAFTLEDKDGHPNIFSQTEANESGYSPTVKGQAKFLYDVMEVVRNVPNERGLGVFYWEPAWLGVDGAGWTAGEGNAWENQAMFDFDGNALESLKVFTPGYVPPEPEKFEPVEEEVDETLAELTLHSLNKPASASSSAGGGNSPEGAVDGDNSTEWGTDQGAGSWWQVDLEEVVSIERVLLEFWDGADEFKLEISDDGESYSTVGTYEITSSNLDLTLPEATTARYLRVTITESSSSWVGFMSFKAYGTDELPEDEKEEVEKRGPCKNQNNNGRGCEQVRSLIEKGIIRGF